ncbi:hypothetical protein [Sphaerisporangium aureirubrum]|uniref:Uncharacterized protein n=1 Tax=Sphaerisporangium aureirubrum TaxID=1544736 RepID=A0ABW1NHC5_9ACTN
MTSPAQRAVRAVVLAAALTVPLLVPGAAHADASYDCASGYATPSPIPVLGPYFVYGEECTGQGGGEPGLVTVPPGTYTYTCGSVWVTGPGTVLANRCE